MTRPQVAFNLRAMMYIGMKRTTGRMVMRKQIGGGILVPMW
ncbi:MAG: hypothetical protein O6700_09220 [Gammaproteobacteria bacterium]|nr:hypothetical protein [Gammaproteobacteria bacterium]